MSTLAFSGWLLLSSLLAGFFGSLTGLGGGVGIVPVLTLLFHVNIHYAVGASLVSVIATSSGAAASYVREGFSNVRIGMFLEVATTLGALFGVFLSTLVSAPTIGVIFGILLLYSAFASFRAKHDVHTDKPDRLAMRLKLKGSFPTAAGDESYVAQRVPAGFGLMYMAGTLSALLGTGAGAVKVLAMDQAMRLPFKVSTTTSNFMIGVTAAAGAGIYLKYGYIAPELAMPVMLGVVVGSMIGAKVLVRARVPLLRQLFAIVIVILGFEMIYNSLAGKL